MQLSPNAMQVRLVRTYERERDLKFLAGQKILPVTLLCVRGREEEGVVSSSYLYPQITIHVDIIYHIRCRQWKLEYPAKADHNLTQILKLTICFTAYHNGLEQLSWRQIHKQPGCDTCNHSTLHRTSLGLIGHFLHRDLTHILVDRYKYTCSHSRKMATHGIKREREIPSVTTVPAATNWPLPITRNPIKSIAHHPIMLIALI